MGEERFNLGGGRFWMTPDEGEPTEFVEVQQVEGFVETEPEELEDADLSDCIRSSGDILMNALAPGFEWNCKISISAKAADRIFLRSFGWESEGHVRKKELWKSLKMEAISLRNKWDSELWEHFIQKGYWWKMLCDYKKMITKLR